MSVSFKTRWISWLCYVSSVTLKLEIMPVIIIIIIIIIVIIIIIIIIA